MIGCIILISTFLNTLIFQLIVSCLTCRKSLVSRIVYLWRNGIIVSTIVGYVQTTIAINECQVTIAIESTCTSCTQGNKVSMIHIMY